MAQPKPKLVLADDHRLIREALCNSLKTEHDIVATASNGEELLLALQTTRADCLLLDLDMPGQHGLGLLPLIRKRHPNLHIIVLTMHSHGLVAASARQKGADGFVTKDAGVEELARAISEVRAGRQYVTRDLSHSPHHVELEGANPMLKRLTPRQQEILLLMGEGKSASAIASRLSVAPSTVTFHKQNMVRVLGLPTQEALREYAILARSTAVTKLEVAPPSRLGTMTG